jgi:hypothetical protein
LVDEWILKDHRSTITNPLIHSSINPQSIIPPIHEYPHRHRHIPRPTRQGSRIAGRTHRLAPPQKAVASTTTPLRRAALFLFHELDDQAALNAPGIASHQGLAAARQ